MDDFPKKLANSVLAGAMVLGPAIATYSCSALRGTGVARRSPIWRTCISKNGISGTRHRGTRSPFRARRVPGSGISISSLQK